MQRAAQAFVEGHPSAVTKFRRCRIERRLAACHEASVVPPAWQSVGLYVQNLGTQSTPREGRSRCTLRCPLARCLSSATTRTHSRGYGRMEACTSKRRRPLTRSTRYSAALSFVFQSILPDCLDCLLPLSRHPETRVDYPDYRPRGICSMRLGLSSARKALPTVAARTISSAGQLAPRVHDCVVVGGGISGLTTAFRLAEVFPSGIAAAQSPCARRLVAART